MGAQWKILNIAKSKVKFVVYFCKPTARLSVITSHAHWLQSCRRVYDCNDTTQSLNLASVDSLSNVIMYASFKQHRILATLVALTRVIKLGMTPEHLVYSCWITPSYALYYYFTEKIACFEKKMYLCSKNK